MIRNLVLLSVVGLMLLALGCSEEMGEKEYFNLANQYMEQQNWQKAEENFAKIYQKHPDGLLASKALFMVGYINANHLENYDRAREYYTKFLEKYPDHELAMAAKYEIEHLGKSVDELPFLIDNESEKGTGENAQTKEPQATSEVN